VGQPLQILFNERSQMSLSRFASPNDTQLHLAKRTNTER
jgi:hypothetical protein